MFGIILFTDSSRGGYNVYVSIFQLGDHLVAAEMIADLVQGVGYDNMITSIKEHTHSAAHLMSSVTDQLFLATSNTLAQRQAIMVKDQLVVLSKLGNDLTTLTSVVNLLNSEQFEAGHEAMLVLNSTNTTVGYILGNDTVLLSQLRYCAGGHPQANCSLTTDVLSAISSALSGHSCGSFMGKTYTQEAAFIAYCPIPSTSLGVVYILPFQQSQTKFLTQVVDAAYIANQTDTVVDLVVEQKSRPGVVLTCTFSPCTVGSCPYDPAGAAHGGMCSPLRHFSWLRGRPPARRCVLRQWLRSVP